MVCARVTRTWLRGWVVPVTVLAVLLVAAQPGSLFGQCSTEIIENGDFEGGFTPDGDGDLIPNGWTEYETFTGGSGEVSTVTSIADNGPSAVGAAALLVSRTNGGSSGDWTSIQQTLNYSVRNAACVELSIDIKVISHNLCGTGSTTTDFEYPISVYINYQDTAGTNRIWHWGWYDWLGTCGPRPDHDVHGNLVVTGQDVDAGVWVANSWDLTTELINPSVITRIRVAGSGWDFQGQADNVSLTVTDGHPLPVPTMTEWGIAILGLLIVTLTATIMVRRRKEPTIA